MRQEVGLIDKASAGSTSGEPGVLAIHGDNFSGRTQYLRNLVGLSDAQAPETPSAYIGPEIYNSLSGLALSVEDELRLHAAKDRPRRSHSSLLEHLGLTSLRHRNPFELSGGEQALTALAAAIALSPETLALDCCFEQIDVEMRERILELLRLDIQHGMAVVMADNRLREYESSLLQHVDTPRPRGVVEDRLLLPVSLPGCTPTPRPAPVIQVDSVRFSYARRGTPVLRDVSITLEPGRVYLLEGKNGSGKSTLAKILSGALHPQAGSLRSDGRAFQPWQYPAHVFAYHFQNPDLQLFSPRVDTELAAGPRALGLSAEETRSTVAAWAQVFGLTDAMSSHPLDLPFVGRKRVALAATLSMTRPWLILDEPTLGQDDATCVLLAQLIRDLAARGSGVVIISHSTSFRHELAGRRILLEEGVSVEHA